MLILTRKPGESLYIGDDIKITIVELKGHQIRVGIDAPKEMRIYREEIYLQILEENKKAAETPAGLDLGLENLSAAWSARASSGDGGSDTGSGSGDSESDGSDKPRPTALGSLSSKLRTGTAPSVTGEGMPSPKTTSDPVVVRRKKMKKNDE